MEHRAFITQLEFKNKFMLGTRKKIRFDKNIKNLIENLSF